MRISGAAGRGGGFVDSRKSAIERQIRKLEQKRDEILEKLGAKKSSKKQDAATISNGTLRVNSTHSSGNGGASTPQINGGETESGVAAPQSNIVSVGTRDFGKALRDLTESLSSSSDAIEPSEDPKELMKQLQLIEMQIMALRQQIGDDSLEPLDMDTKQAATLAAAGMGARETDRATESAVAFPVAEVSAEGRVDGYA